MAEQAENSGQEKTEAPTQFRREEFRKQGQVALSKELQSVGILLAMGGAFYYIFGFFFKEFTVLLERHFIFNDIVEFDKGVLLGLITSGVKDISWLLFPVALVTMGVGFFIAVCQVGFHTSWESMSLKWERLNPISGFARLFSWKGIVEG
ncbi:unnamed protein product, partial [marine sediment metagenome]